MKSKVFCLLFALMLVLPLTMVAADPAMANSVSSATMVFQGTLSDDGDGSYTGTIAMVDEATAGLGDGVAGFDLYAKNGAKATYDQAGSGTESYLCGTIVDHDAYTTAGGWGTEYDPDCGDWYNYQLRFSGDYWYVEYNADVGTDGVLTGATAPPMSGTMDWSGMYAAETGVGGYYSGMGTSENDGYALDNPCTGINDGSGAWDMDWSWGSEYIPLQFPGYQVEIEELGGDVYRVSLTPAGSGSSAQLTVSVPDIVAISVDPTSIDYGELRPGDVSAQHNIVVTNIGTHTATIDIEVAPGGTVFDYLKLYSYTVADWVASVSSNWDDFITGLAMDDSETVPTKLWVPSDYVPQDDESATLVFTATGE